MANTHHHSCIMRSWTSLIQSSFNTHPRISCRYPVKASMSLYVLFQKSYESSHWKEKSEADGSISACSLGCFTTARRLALKIFMETTHPAGGSKRNCVLFARMPEARLPKGNRLCGVTPGDGHPCTHTDARGGPQPGRSYGRAVLGRDREEPLPSSRCRWRWALPGRFEELGTARPMLQLQQGRRRTPASGWLVPITGVSRGAAASPRGAAALRGGAGAGKLPEVSGCPSQPRAQPPALSLSPKAPTAPAD